MAVHYKFKSAKDFDSISIEGHFITVGHLKDKIFESKQLGKGKDYDLVVINAQTNEEYLDESTLIPKNSSVLIRRLPALPHKPIVTTPVTNRQEKVVENRHESASKTSFLGVGQSVTVPVDELDDDQFGNDPYDIPKVAPVISVNPINLINKAEEDRKIQALVNTPALDWKQTFDGFGRGRGFGRGMGGRGFGRGGFELQKPPEGYVCHRCTTPGHFIQHCPTNGDPNFDIKRVKPPTGIPKSMLVATPDGSYVTPTGATAVMKPNVAVFEKEIEGMPTTRNVNKLPPELHCPLCKQVMKDAALTSTCCFRSFCYECIRDQIISKTKCVCGATDILVDNLLPNYTVRDTIRRILESNNNSLAKGSQAPSQHVEAPKIQGSAKETLIVQSEALEKGKITKVPDISKTTHDTKVPDIPKTTHDKVPDVSKTTHDTKVPDVSKTTHDLRNVKEPALQGSVVPADEKAQHKQVTVEPAEKKKKKKVKLRTNVAEMQWATPEDFAVESTYGPFPYNPYWNVMHSGMEAYMDPYGGANAIPPFMGYGPFGMMPPQIPPHRDLEEPETHMNNEPPVMSREEFETHKAELRQKHGLERGGQSRESSLKYKESQREVYNSGDVSSTNLKSISPPPNVHHRHRHRRHHLSPEHHSGERMQQSLQPIPPAVTSKRKSSHRRDDSNEDTYRHRHHHDHRHRPVPTTMETPATDDDRRYKKRSTVFSRIKFSGEDEESRSKKQNVKFPSIDTSDSGDRTRRKDKSPSCRKEERHQYHKTSSPAPAPAVDTSEYDSRHFKRRTSRYSPSPSPGRKIAAVSTSQTIGIQDFIR